MVLTRGHSFLTQSGVEAGVIGGGGQTQALSWAVLTALESAQAFPEQSPNTTQQK